MEKQRIGTGKVFGLWIVVGAILLLPGSARAADVNVDCNAGGSINGALAGLDLVGPHTITVTGTCAEQVAILSRARVTIQAPEGETATINGGGGIALLVSRSHNIVFRRLAITGGFFGLLLEQGSQAEVESSTIENNQFGVFAFASSTLFVSSTNVRDNGVSGATAVAGSMMALAPEVTVEHNGQGVAITDTSAAGVFNSTIQNNAGFGIVLTRASNLILGGNTIVGNGAAGVRVSQTSHAEIFANTIRNNGAADPSSPGGLVLTEQGEAFIGGGNDPLGNIGGNDISNNTGPGIFVGTNSTLSSTGSNTITNNTAEGVNLRRQSVGQFFAADTISGNGGPNLACDTTSLAAGELAGVTNIKCMRIERELGPPRPGRITDLPYELMRRRP